MMGLGDGVSLDAAAAAPKIDAAGLALQSASAEKTGPWEPFCQSAAAVEDGVESSKLRWRRKEEEEEEEDKPLE